MAVETGPIFSKKMKSDQERLELIITGRSGKHGEDEV
jgi:hypothetical protein